MTYVYQKIEYRVYILVRNKTTSSLSSLIRNKLWGYIFDSIINYLATTLKNNILRNEK